MYWLWGRVQRASLTEAESQHEAGAPPDEHGPQDRLEPPPQMSLHAMVQLPAAACLHCSPDVPALGNKVCQAGRALG